MATGPAVRASQGQTDTSTSPHGDAGCSIFASSNKEQPLASTDSPRLPVKAHLHRLNPLPVSSTPF